MPPATQPGRDTKPPMIAAASARITITPMSGVIKSFGASRMPATPASAEARPHAVMLIARTGRPTRAAAGGFWLVARSALPTSVWLKKAHSAIMIALWAFFSHTLVGKALRATSQNPPAAALVGLPVRAMSMTAWGLASALAGVAGILLAPKLLITPDMGVIVILALAAAIIGGFVSLPGCVAGGIVLRSEENT